ncbi:hypothetical protein PC9H_010850 [Pleurotus ostreatus]|uniref:G domain-containing protein n=1 Tax=Pleurotus ostreatus TaxID=5322 RepID=A0A8H6ZNK7_PLEOS|nr:uncharacterized protein PC9H_010850 [Pleurotus ostreatus]KAF7422694.1 hypothetical protein PC9H_010850 [Pleurotus ostreatus]
MGATGSGKTTFVNMASGDNLAVGGDLESCTSVVQMCKPFGLDGRRVILVDTPGFDDTRTKDIDILAMIAAFLTTTYEEGKLLAGVIYMHRISDVRMGGLSVRNFRLLRRLCGEKTLKNLAIVTNMWGEVSHSVGEAREAELASKENFFKPALDKGAMLLRHTNTFDSAANILRHFIRSEPLPLQIQDEIVHKHMDLPETAAGVELHSELQALMRKHEQEIRMLKAEMSEALRLKENELRDEIRTEIHQLQGESNRFRRDAQEMASKYESEKSRLESQIRESAEAAKREQAKLINEYEGKLSEFEKKIQEGAPAWEVVELRMKIIALEKEMADMHPNNGGCTIC